MRARDQGLRQIKSSAFKTLYYVMPRNHDAGQSSSMALATPAPMIYVVDDDCDVLGSLRFLLETDGFDVRTFRSGAALLSGSMVDEANCFVIDYKMPFMNGIDLAKRLQGRHLDAPIILVTGYPDGNIEEKAAAAGIRHVLLKPHLEGTLVSRIWDAIQGDPAAGQ